MTLPNNLPLKRFLSDVFFGLLDKNHGQGHFQTTYVPMSYAASLTNHCFSVASYQPLFGTQNPSKLDQNHFIHPGI